MITPARLFETLDRTWPPAGTSRLGPWLVRDGQGGGKRVSAATPEAEVFDADIDSLEAEARARGEAPLVRLASDDPLDARLAARGYARLDPTLILTGNAADLAARPLPRLAAIPAWPPLARMREIWADGGIPEARIAVMARARGPHTGLFGRAQDRPAGVAFVALHEDIAMLHALEVAPAHRRAGAGRALVVGAAHWAVPHGATTLAVAVTEANAPARALYSSLGFSRAAGYHYRQKQE